MAVTKLDNWVTTVTNSANTLAFGTISSGSNRCMIVFITSEATPPAATAISLGGQSGEQITGSPIQAGSAGTAQVVSGWLIKEAAIAARSNETITITFTTQPTTVSIQAAVYAGVDQTTPIQEYQEEQTGAATPNPMVNVDIDVASTGNYVVACGGSGGVYTAAWQADLTEQTELAMNATSAASVGEADPSSTGNITVELTWSAQNRASIMSIEVQEAQSAYEIVGVTKDKDGNTKATCEVFCFKDNGDDTLTFVAHTTSDVSGNYTIGSIGDNDANYLCYSFKDDTPHVMDVTDHVLQPTAE